MNRTDEAFCALFEVVCARVHRYFLLRGFDRPTAEDLTQNVLLKVYLQAGELKNAQHFYGWLFVIARNEMIGYWRGRQARIETVGIESLERPQAGTARIAGQPTLRLSRWLEMLDPAERDLIVLRFVEGLSYEELACVLEIPLGTVKWRIFNARKKLTKVMERSKARKKVKHLETE